MSLADEIADLIHDEGPKTLEQLRARFAGWNGKQVANAVMRAVHKQRAHNTSKNGVEAVYKWGPSPGWLPDPLPANSVWQHAERCAATRYEVPVFLGSAT